MYVPLKDAAFTICIFISINKKIITIPYNEERILQEITNIRNNGKV